MSKGVLFTTALLSAAATAPPAHAQSCALRDTVADRLSSQFKEQVVSGGLQDENRLIEVWASEETGTFTVLITRADGLTCVLATGTNFHQNQPQPVVDDTAG